MANIKRFLICGIVAGPFFIVMSFLEGVTRSGYNAFRDPISSLSLGPYGWVQMLNFFLSGTLILLFAIGLHKQFKKASTHSFWGPLLISLAGIGCFGAGVFPTDPFIGYPAMVPFSALPQTLHGQLHNFVSAFFFFGLPVASFVFTRYFFKARERLWGIYSLLSGIGALIFFILTSISIVASMGSEPSAGLLNLYTVGLMQRITVVIIFLWVTLLAVHMLKRSTSSKKKN